MSTPQRYRKKPVEIDAIQWIGAPASEVLPSATSVIDWILANGGTARYHEERTHDTSEVAETSEVKSFERPEPVPEHIAIDTLEGTMRALPGDYIIRGVQGEFYPCKPDIFAQMYDDATSKPLTAKASIAVRVVIEGEDTGPTLGTFALVVPKEFAVDQVRDVVAQAIAQGRLG